MKSTFTPKGPFDLLFQNQFFNGWPTLLDDPSTIVMTFPVEGWSDSVAVTLQQQSDGTLATETFGTKSPEVALAQALASMSLDEDGSAWPEVGKRDPVLGALQEKYRCLRPTMFHSPYEAAAAFIIGHRITIAQTRKIRAQLAVDYGDKIDVGGQAFYAFPAPQKLLEITEIKGLNETKMNRLHAVAEAALESWLNRAFLRDLSEADALAKLETLPGVGPFFSQGILYRGCGLVDGFIDNPMNVELITKAYGLPEKTSADEIKQLAEQWHPYRSWATVMLHLEMRRK